MGEIADMHVEAFAAGLDPNEMDGADWAGFFEERLTPENRIEDFGVDARILLCSIDDAGSGDDYSIEARAETLATYLRGLSDEGARAIVHALVSLSDASNEELARLEAEGINR